MTIRHNPLLFLLTAAALTATSSAPAQAATGQLVNVSDGTILTRGTVVSLQVTYTCEAGTGAVANAHINVLQRVQGGNIAQASASSPTAECTGEPQTFDLTLQAFERAFKKGAAQAGVTLTVCDPFTCEQPTYTQQIQLVAK